MKIRLEMKPEIVMLDFEHEAINAFGFHFPFAQIKACFFHLGQSFYRRLCAEGLKEQYKADLELKKWIKKIICLALVPIDQVENCFMTLCENKPDYGDKIENFADYILLN